MTNEYLLEMKNIEKSFGAVKAITDGELKIRAGTVHALMGENGAGKSTLMKCLFGIYHKDAGEIILDGKKVNFRDSADALTHNVAMVHQELNQVLFQNVMENMWLGRYPLKRGLIDVRIMEKKTKEIFDSLDIDVDPYAKVGTLQVAQKQMIEIAKAISYNSKILVLDEPTSSLTEKEVSHLFEIMNKLTSQGIGIIFITHKINEVMEMADDITVMRDGRWVDTKQKKEITEKEIIHMMVGREMNEQFPEKTNKIGNVLLKVENLSTKEHCFSGVNFELRAGEILGIAGLVGARRTEVLETLFGSRARGSGTITYKGKELNVRDELDAIQNGLAMVTEERRYNGIYAGMSVTFNMTISNLKNYVKHGIIDDKLVGKDVEKMVSSMSIKVNDPATLIKNLSGGNQQKVILSRWLLTNPEILLLDEPTRGIDVGAKYEIYKLIDQLAAQGKAIIMVSSEMPEIFGVCDRILVMSNGRQSGVFTTKEVSQVDVMTAAAKFV
jgi:methyl-galactoside transport system ATP-binding protein